MDRISQASKQIHTKLLANTLELIQISLILLLVLDLLLNALKYPHSGSIVIDASGGTESCFNDRRCRHEIVCEAVVEATLHLEEVLGGLEEVDVSFVESFERLLGMPAGEANERGCSAGDGGASTNESGEDTRADHVDKKGLFVVEDGEDD